MIRGVFIEGTQSSHIIDFLQASLLNMERFLWVVDYYFQYDDPKAIPDGIYQGNVLKDMIDKAIRPQEVRIRKYPKDTNIGEISDISDYEDYLRSDCLLCIVAYDTSMLEVYIKDSVEQEEVFTCCKSIPHDTLEWITEKNDGRTGFSPIGGYGNGFP